MEEVNKVLRGDGREAPVRIDGCAWVSTVLQQRQSGLNEKENRFTRNELEMTQLVSV